MGCFQPDLATAARTKRAGDTRPEQFQIIIDLGHRSYGRTRAFDRVRLFDGDRWGNATNVVHPRLVHAVEKLPHVGTEGFDVSPLAFGVNSFEGQARFAAAARPSNNRQFTEWKIDIDSLQI